MGDESRAPEARMDLDTRCAACSVYRYHDKGQGFMRNGNWFCGELCYARLTPHPSLLTGLK